jgi:valyl-tRNA synthetase
VYFTGIVRDKIGRKMSKTLGNSPNPLDLIETYGADAVRIGMLLCSSAGNDIFYDEAQIKQGAAFCNKIWNSYRLVKGFSVDDNVPQTDVAVKVIRWFDAKLSHTIEIVEGFYEQFRISDALMAIYKLFWDDYCSVYLERIKPEYKNGASLPISAKTYEVTLGFFEDILKLIHPVMPFITEELWHVLREREDGTTIMFEAAPKKKAYNSKVLNDFEQASLVNTATRNVIKTNNLSTKDQLIREVKDTSLSDLFSYIDASTGTTTQVVEEFSEGPGITYMVGTIQCHIPYHQSDKEIESEIAKLEKDLAYQQKFLAGVRGKLANERFVAHAPAAVIENERKKEADSLSKIESLESQLNILRNSQ